jgi:hypothetical protein
MSISLRASALAAAVGLATLVPSASFAADAKDCRHFRAVGSGITQSVATLMATQGAINLAENRGYTVQGEAKLEGCKAAGTFGNECAATSYACKLPH